MRLRILTVLGAVVLLGLPWWWHSSSTRLDRSATGAAQQERAEAAPAAAPATASDPDTNPSATVASRELDPTRASAAASDPAATWIVELHALRGWSNPYPRVA